MLNLSLNELFIAFLIAALILKPKDIKNIIIFSKKVINYIHQIKNQISDVVLENEKLINKESIEEINFYLEKIIAIEGEYKGDYNLEKIKKHYLSSIKKSIDKEKGENEKEI